jgi:hypothetical protein
MGSLVETVQMTADSRQLTAYGPQTSVTREAISDARTIGY